jgi:hypothetical protein
MENYTVETECKIGGTETEDCRLLFKIDGKLFYEMQFHWMSAKDSIKHFGKLPDLIHRMNNVIIFGDSSCRTNIDNIIISISENIINFWIPNTNYYILHLKINESLLVAFKQLYNWYYKYIKIYEEAPPSTMLVEDNTLFASAYKVVTIPKDKIPDKLHPPYKI